jgi:hypothetical protein
LPESAADKAQLKENPMSKKLTSAEIAANKATAKNKAISKALCNQSIKEGNNKYFAKTIVQQLDDLCERRKQWEATDFKKANDGLYTLLSECLDVFQAKFVNGTDSDRRTLRTDLAEKLKAANVKVQKNTNTLTMFARVVFASDRKRAHGYAYVLTAAISHNKTAAQLPEWIASEGGIEEIKRNMVKKPEAIARKDAIDAAKVKLSAELELAAIAPLAEVEITGLSGNYAVLLVKPNPNGGADVVGTLNEVNEALVNALLVRMAKSRVKQDAENAQLGKEKQDLMGETATNQPVFAKAA